MRVRMCAHHPWTTPHKLQTTAGHMAATPVPIDAGGGAQAIASLAAPLLARAGARRAALSGRDLSSALHAAGKLQAVRTGRGMTWQWGTASKKECA